MTKKSVSIHAPTRGATYKHVSVLLETICFNSRAHKGRDESVLENMPGLVWFQFTRPQGARQIRFLARESIRLFQFTRPQGARQMFIV